MRHIGIFIGAVIILTGCSTTAVGDYRSPEVNANFVIEPTARSNYRGVLVEFSSATAEELMIRAAEICSVRGGLRSEPTYFSNNVLGWRFYNYQCNGPRPVQLLQPVQQQPIVRQPVEALQSSVSLEQAKLKCTELGFKEGTEGFGKCVLQLSK